MIIIKQGKTKEELKQEKIREAWWLGLLFTCDKCSTEIKLDEDDFDVVIIQPIFFKNVLEYSVQCSCPNCNYTMRGIVAESYTKSLKNTL